VVSSGAREAHATRWRGLIALFTLGSHLLTQRFVSRAIAQGFNQLPPEILLRSEAVVRLAPQREVVGVVRATTRAGAGC